MLAFADKAQILRDSHRSRQWERAVHLVILHENYTFFFSRLVFMTGRNLSRCIVVDAATTLPVNALTNRIGKGQTD